MLKKFEKKLPATDVNDGSQNNPRQTFLDENLTFKLDNA